MRGVKRWGREVGGAKRWGREVGGLSDVYRAVQGPMAEGERG